MSSCTQCSHEKVCAIKEYYQETIEAVNNARVYGDRDAELLVKDMDDFYVDINCKHFSVIVSDLRGNNFEAVMDEKPEEKKKYALMYSAEGNTTGTMMLTESEAALIERVTDTDNWDDLDEEGWSGCLYIGPMEEEK